MKEQELRKVIEESFSKEDIFLTQVGPNLFRLGMGNGNAPMYMNETQVREFNQAMKEEHERYWKDKEKS